MCMKRKYHILIFLLCFSFTMIIGVLNYNLNSLFELFSTKKHIIAIVIYTLLFMAVYYTGIWVYFNSKKMGEF